MTSSFVPTKSVKCLCHNYFRKKKKFRLIYIISPFILFSHSQLDITKIYSKEFEFLFFGYSLRISDKIRKSSLSPQSEGTERSYVTRGAPHSGWKRVYPRSSTFFSLLFTLYSMNNIFSKKEVGGYWNCVLEKVRMKNAHIVR